MPDAKSLSPRARTCSWHVGFLRVPTDVREFIRRLHPELKRKVRATLFDILNDPSCTQIFLSAAIKRRNRTHQFVPAKKSRVETKRCKARSPTNLSTSRSAVEFFQ
jgi:hypothetical protein